LFLTCGNGTVKILDYETMDTLHTLKAHTSSCFSLELSPDGNYLAIGGTDALLTLWDTWDWYCKRSLAKMTGPIRTLSFSWDGGYLVAGSEDDVGLEIAHVDSGQYIHTVDTSPAAAPIVQWSPRDYSLAYSINEAPGGLRIINGSSLI
jgi:THO complex subunit 3